MHLGRSIFLSHSGGLLKKVEKGSMGEGTEPGKKENNVCEIFTDLFSGKKSVRAEDHLIMLVFNFARC